ncbi:hypothetical protein K7432_016392 [Basidiobolus ranarum]|uniref:Uncharacterized protein n=1 Tax=Basidiobolus ranarum TaxID=34480 RepID=A0ABR2VLN9_9FUNG
MPLQVVKEIEDVVYGRVSSTIERPAASFHPNQQEELPGYSTGPTTTNASNSTLTPYGLNNETSMLQT